MPDSPIPHSPSSIEKPASTVTPRQDIMPLPDSTASPCTQHPVYTAPTSWERLSSREEGGMQAVDETRSPNATGKLPDNSKHDLHNANMNTEDAIKSEALAGGSNLIVDPDGVSRVAGHTVYLPVPCSGCVQAEKRCTGVQGKACDRCRSQRTKCSIPRGNGRGGAKSVDKSNTETKKSGGVKRKSEGGGQTRKRPRRDVTYFDSEAVDIEEAMEREESDDAFHIIGEYVAAYDKMVDWFRREKTRRARRS